MSYKPLSDEELTGDFTWALRQLTDPAQARALRLIEQARRANRLAEALKAEQLAMVRYEQAEEAPHRARLLREAGAASNALVAALASYRGDP